RLRDGLAVLVDHEHGLRIRVSMKDFADPVDLLQLLLVHDELLDHRALAPGPRKMADAPSTARALRRRVTVATHQNSFNVLAHLSYARQTPGTRPTLCPAGAHPPSGRRPPPQCHPGGNPWRPGTTRGVRPASRPTHVAARAGKPPHA